MLGLVGGMALKSQSVKPDRRERPVEMSQGPFEERLARMAMYDLEDSDRELFRDQLRASWLETQPLRNDMEQVRERIANAIAADPYDPAELKAAFAELREKDDVMRSRLNATLADFITNIPDEKRRTLLERSMERRDRFRDGPGGSRGDGHRPPPPDGFGKGPDGPPPEFDGPPPERPVPTPTPEESEN